uniref:EamA domain-containing protein n=4 Tax=Aegilops tauschii subsp. strangulata TaxID=200361 RepID=A0A453RAY6_AEGTS
CPRVVCFAIHSCYSAHCTDPSSIVPPSPPSSGEMLLSELPNPPRPWRPRVREAHSARPRHLPLPGSPTTPLPRRRHLLLSPSATPSDDPALPPARRPSHPKRASGEGEGWTKKAVPPGTLGLSSPVPEEPLSPPRWTAGRQARTAWRKATSLVPRRARSVILLNLLVLIFASNISIVKEAQTMLDPDLFNIIRFTIAAIPFVPFLLKSLRDMQVVIRGVELGVWVTLAYLTQSIGLVTADAGRASFISALTVIIVPFLDGILGAEIPAYTWLGAFLSALGVGILELSGSPPCVSRLSTCKGPQVFLNVFFFRTMQENCMYYIKDREGVQTTKTF